MSNKVLIFFLFTVAPLILIGCNNSPEVQNHVTLGIQTSPAMALVMVAKDKGFFEQEGLNVELKEFTAGKLALAAFLSGSLDFSISGDVPAALAYLQGNKFLVPAQVVKSTKNEVRIVARKDDTALTADTFFKNKKRILATSFGGGPEFFTYEFLNTLGITKQNVELVSQQPGDMPAAIINGDVDAIAIFDPFAFIAEKQLGEKSITFTDPTIYSELYILEANESIKDNPEIIGKLLRGLIDAQNFTDSNPEEAKKIVMKYTKLDQQTMDTIWGDFDFHIGVTPQLLTFWQREAIWAKDTGKIKNIPKNINFRDLIYDLPLKNIIPSAVEI